MTTFTASTIKSCSNLYCFYSLTPASMFALTRSPIPATIVVTFTYFISYHNTHVQLSCPPFYPQKKAAVATFLCCYTLKQMPMHLQS